MNCCDANGNCDQGRNCPVRAARMSGGVGLPPVDEAAAQQHGLRGWELISFWAMVCLSTVATAVWVVGLAGLYDERLGLYLSDLLWALLTRLG
jgi:hypothetical protein